jgi:hypothetical protein
MRQAGHVTHMRGFIQFWKEIAYSGSQHVDGILKWIREIRYEDVGWFLLAEDGDQW